MQKNPFDFQKLTVYQKAKQFHMLSKDITSSKALPNYTRNQLGRASLSIPLNIAEGSGKFSEADRRNYFTTARASVFECVAIADILRDTGAIEESHFEKVISNADELSRILFAMIKNLR